jgi:hypothetical protein
VIFGPLAASTDCDRNAKRTVRTSRKVTANFCVKLAIASKCGIESKQGSIKIGWGERVDE